MSAVLSTVCGEHGRIGVHVHPGVIRKRPGFDRRRLRNHAMELHVQEKITRKCLAQGKENLKMRSENLSKNWIPVSRGKVVQTTTGKRLKTTAIWLVTLELLGTRLRNIASSKANQVIW